jgi:hypothetical protein
MKSPIENEKFDKLLFGVKRSSRYHSSRQYFLDTTSKTITFLSTIGGFGTLTTVLSNHPEASIIFGLVVGVAGALELVFAFGATAKLHSDIGREFILLEKEMTLCKDKTEDQIKQFESKRLEIEYKEPPILPVLDIICHNELVKSMGRKEGYYKLNYFDRILCQIPNFWFKADTVKMVGVPSGQI